MSDVSATMLTRSTPDRAKKPSRSMLLRLDGRTVASRRIAELRTLYADAVGADAQQPMVMERIEAAAQLTVTAELARARWLAEDDGAPPLDDVVRTERLAAAAVRRLGIGQQQTKPQPTLADYLSGKSGEAA